ncbi:MAG: PEP-CTERM sorting domain-containing protein [Kiritimatiellales bacterium]|nr:PEP-CTERM sorting domain-containing protein [Kiritimatiellales bacterium]
MKKIWMGIFAMLCSGSAMATLIFQDNFDSNGALNGRTPDVGSVNWTGSANLTVANGVLMTKAAAASSAWLALPDIVSGDIIRVSAVIVGNVALNTQYIGIGLTTNASALYLRGAPYVTMKHGGTAGDDRGYFNVYGGLGNSNPIDQNAYLTEAGGYTTNLNARNTVNFEYDTATGNMTAWLNSEGGTTVTQYVGSVNYGGIADAAIPVELINFLGIQFTTGAINTSANPGYLDNLTVEIIPEPATLGLIIAAGLGAMLFRRMKL